MKGTTVVAVALLAVLGSASALRAHDSGSMFDPAAIWVTGTVVQYERVNPHARMVLEGTTADGQVQRWTVEGPNLRRIEQMGVEPRVGDVVEVCGFALRAEVALQGPSPDPYGQSPRFVHGHALRMPDVHMEMFGPYGKLDNCLRPGDDPQRVDFVSTNGSARAAWCNGQGFKAPSTGPNAILDAINSRMANPCN